MQANGVPEPLVTGDADPYEKFLAWCKTVPNTMRNPLYHWSHLELRRYFDIDLIVCEDTAEEIWNVGNERLKSEDLRAQKGILKNFKGQDGFERPTIRPMLWSITNQYHWGWTQKSCPLSVPIKDCWWMFLNSLILGWIGWLKHATRRSNLERFPVGFEVTP